MDLVLRDSGSNVALQQHTPSTFSGTATTSPEPVSLWDCFPEQIPAGFSGLEFWRYRGLTDMSCCMPWDRSPAPHSHLGRAAAWRRLGKHGLNPSAPSLCKIPFSVAPRVTKVPEKNGKCIHSLRAYPFFKGTVVTEGR